MVDPFADFSTRNNVNVLSALQVQKGGLEFYVCSCEVGPKNVTLTLDIYMTDPTAPVVVVHMKLDGGPRDAAFLALSQAIKEGKQTPLYRMVGKGLTRHLQAVNG